MKAAAVASVAQSPADWPASCKLVFALIGGPEALRAVNQKECCAAPAHDLWQKRPLFDDCRKAQNASRYEDRVGDCAKQAEPKDVFTDQTLAQHKGVLGANGEDQ